ncbi:uncharacterized protein LOC142886952 isoform X2 [Nelusetta ayraudi]
MHITIQEGSSLPELQRCTTCCDLYHCPYCQSSLFKPTYLCKVKSHVEGHFKRAVSHEGYTILRCGLQCKSQLHYHCVHCQATVLRRESFVKHLRVCKNKQPAVKASATVAQVTQSDESVGRDAYKQLCEGLDEAQRQPKEECQLRQVTGSGDDADREPEKDEQHGSVPVVSTSFSHVDSGQSLHQEMEVAPKRKRENSTEARCSLAHSTNCRDEDELFLLSLLPSIKRLTIKKRMEVRMKFQQVLYAAEFEA